MNWTIDAWAGRVAVSSDAMPPDSAIELVGDFGTQAERMKFAERVCQAMNMLQQLEDARTLSARQSTFGPHITKPGVPLGEWEWPLAETA